MKIKYVLAGFLVLLGIMGKAQQNEVNLWNPPVQKGVKKLNPGDQLPGLKLKVLNSSKPFLNTSDLNDQLVIYDFGNTQCKGCIEALPHMAALVQQFKGKVSILWVTPEPAKKMQHFWATNKYVKDIRVTTVLDDSTLRAYFPHRSWPHEAWVYKGKLIALTGADYVDANNIRKVLNGEQVNWPVKDDFYVFDAAKEHLFTPDPNQIDTVSTLLKYAAISGYKEKASAEGYGVTGIVRNASNKTIRAYVVNHPIYIAYLKSWMQTADAADLVKPSFNIEPNQVVWEVADKNKYTFITGNGYQQSWLLSNGICFESVKPDTGQTDKQVHQSIIDDLDRLLGLKVRWEKRKEKVFVLVRTDKNKDLKSKEALTSYDERVTKGNLHQFRDTPLSTIAYQMNKEANNPYVFDETGYAENTDLNLSFSSWTDITGIKKSLQTYGLDLKEEERIVDKFVFTERK